MAIPRTRPFNSFNSLTIKSMELAFAVPQVFAHRVTRMALAGPRLSDRDRKEFERMLHEKHAAFARAWGDMAMHSFQANQAFAASMVPFFLTPFSYTRAAALAAAHVQDATIGVLNKGLAPIHRKAILNARRLAKTRLC